MRRSLAIFLIIPLILSILTVGCEKLDKVETEEKAKLDKELTQSPDNDSSEDAEAKSTQPPAETKAQLSPECIDFLSCLLAGPESRIGSSKNGTEFQNGFKQVVQHKWFKGFDWEGLPNRDGPLLPSGSKEFDEVLFH